MAHPPATPPAHKGAVMSAPQVLEIPPEMKSAMEARFVRLLENYARACETTPKPSDASQNRAAAYRDLARIVAKHGV